MLGPLRLAVSRGPAPQGAVVRGSARITALGVKLGMPPRSNGYRRRMTSTRNALACLDAVLARLRELGAVRFLGKALAPNDNSKNQVYFGPGFSALNLLPAGEVRPTPGSTTMKAPLNWSWLTPAGTLCQAPGAQLILYPQYPEVRLSGFLIGCAEAPSTVMASRDQGRMLLLGITYPYRSHHPRR